jgi:hypothetical protein
MTYIITTKTAADDIATLLASLGYGTIGTDLFINKEPDVPHECVTVYEGSAHGTPETGYSWESPSVQVRVRRKAGDYQNGKLEVLKRMNALHGYVGTVGVIKYSLIRVVNGPVPLGEDEKGRPRWVFNCEIQRST